MGSGIQVRTSGRLAALFGASLLVVSCGVTVRDASFFEYNPADPANTQSFQAEVTPRGSSVVADVRVEVQPSGPAAAMAPVGGVRNLYAVAVPLRGCPDVVEYRFVVRYGTARNPTASTKIAPQAGLFRKPVIDPQGLCASGPPAGAGLTFYVNSPDDTPDRAPGDGVCAAASGALLPSLSGPPCSLRAAVMEANAHRGADVIALPTSGGLSPGARFRLTRRRPGAPESDGSADAAYGDLDITEAVTIHGSNVSDLQQSLAYSRVQPGNPVLLDEPEYDSSSIAKIDAGGLDRVFQIHRLAGVVTMESIIILNGRAQGRPGGGLLNAGRLALRRVAIIQNEAENGGGLYSENHVDLEDVLLAHNSAEVNGGGLFNATGGIVVAARSLFAYNAATAGSGAYNSRAATVGSLNFEIEASTFAWNGAAGFFPRRIASVLHNRGEIDARYLTFAYNQGDDIWQDLRANGLFRIGNSIARECYGEFESKGGNIIRYFGSVCRAPRPPALPDLGSSFDIGALDPRGLRFIVGAPFLPIIPLNPVAAPAVGLVDRLDPASATFDCRGELDQLGRSRPIDGDGNGVSSCDPGAYEYRPGDIRL